MVHGQETQHKVVNGLQVYKSQEKLQKHLKHKQEQVSQQVLLKTS